jgi:hypothetical protein
VDRRWLGGAAPLFSACGRLRHELLPREHGEGAETLWELTGSGLQQMSVVLRPASINGDGQSVDSSLRWMNPGGRRAVVGKCLWCRGCCYDRILYAQSGVRDNRECERPAAEVLQCCGNYKQICQLSNLDISNKWHVPTIFSS